MPPLGDRLGRVGRERLRSAPVNAHDARCGPPAPSGLAVTALTRGGSDFAAARLGSLYLGRGRDLGFGFDARVFGGPGNDELRGAGAAALSGGDGSDTLIAFGRAGQDLDGNDRAFVSRSDRVSGCDRLTAGWPG